MVFPGVSELLLFLSVTSAVSPSWLPTYASKQKFSGKTASSADTRRSPAPRRAVAPWGARGRLAQVVAAAGAEQPGDPARDAGLLEPQVHEAHLGDRRARARHIITQPNLG
jgi:hypothetical protein